MRDDPDISILIKDHPTRNHKKKLFDVDTKYKDYKLKADFRSYLHPDNLEEALVSWLKKT